MPVDPKDPVFREAFSAAARSGLSAAAAATWSPSLPRDPRLLVPVDVEALVVPPGRQRAARRRRGAAPAGARGPRRDLHRRRRAGPEAVHGRARPAAGRLPALVAARRAHGRRRHRRHQPGRPPEPAAAAQPLAGRQDRRRDPARPDRLGDRGRPRAAGPARRLGGERRRHRGRHPHPRPGHPDRGERRRPRLGRRLRQRRGPLRHARRPRRRRSGGGGELRRRRLVLPRGARPGQPRGRPRLVHPEAGRAALERRRGAAGAGLRTVHAPRRDRGDPGPRGAAAAGAAPGRRCGLAQVRRGGPPGQRPSRRRRGRASRCTTAPCTGCGSTAQEATRGRGRRTSRSPSAPPAWSRPRPSCASGWAAIPRPSGSCARSATGCWPTSPGPTGWCRSRRRCTGGRSSPCPAATSRSGSGWATRSPGCDRRRSRPRAR